MQVLDNFLDNDEGNHRSHNPDANANANAASSPPSSSTHITTAASVTSSESATRNRSSAAAASSTSASAYVHGDYSANGDNLDDDNLDSNTDLSEEMKAQIRSERKRTREKQRRSDVNSQFASLTELLKRVEGYDLDSDVSDDDDETETKKRKISSVAVINVTPSNRVDLIARTIAVMDRLHQVNRTLRRNVKGLRKTLHKVKLGSDGDDLKKPGTMNSGMMGSGMMGQNGQYPGMMMMMPAGGMQQMGMMGQSMPQQGDGQQVSLRYLKPMLECDCRTVFISRWTPHVLLGHSRP